MRFVWGSLLGLLLCGTLVNSGISFEDLEDGVLSSNVEDITSLLRAEHLMHADDDDETDLCKESEIEECEDKGKKCIPDPGGNPNYGCVGCLDNYHMEGEDCLLDPCKDTDIEICKELGKKCMLDPSPADNPSYTCNECLQNFQEDDGVKCVPSTCTNNGTNFCLDKKKICTEMEVEGEGFACGECIKNYQKSGEECIPSTCTNNGTNFCLDKKKICIEGKEEGEGFACGECIKNYQKSGDECVSRNCTEPKMTECKGLKKNCIVTDDTETCKDCLEGFQEKDGKCKEICSDSKISECNAFNKGCTKTGKSETCDPCLQGFEERKGICKGICADAGRVLCRGMSRFCTKTDKESCDNCLDGYAEHDGKCKECNCGEADCSFGEDGKQICTCPVKKAHFNKKCIDCDCGETDKCEVDDKGKKKQCQCDPKQEIFKGKCKACDCGGQSCKFTTGGDIVCFCPEGKAKFNDDCLDCECGDSNNCSFNKDGKKECECKPKQKKTTDGSCADSCDSKGTAECRKQFRQCTDKEDGYECGECIANYKDDGGECKKKCKDKGTGACKNGGTCTDEICQCKEGTSGDLCEVVDACKEDPFKGCKDSGGTCVFKDDRAQCSCPSTKKLVADRQVCQKKCTKDKECNNGKCENELCRCNKGYDGDFCDNIIKCTDSLKKTCKEAKADCKYDDTRDDGVCVCKNQNYIFLENSCNTAKWCHPNPCSGAQCELIDGVGQCKCGEKQYFDYSAKACKPVNPCIQKSCGSNEKCDPNDSGKCKCIDGFEREAEGKPCVLAKACKEDSCFPGAKCDETKVPNVVKCTCEKPKFYTNDGCKNGECLFNKKCSECPEGLTLVDGVCKAEKDKECSEDCGFGVCVKEGENQKCVCQDADFIEEKDGTCLLSNEACASGKVQSDGKKCICDGIYVMSSNGITCRRKTCEDDKDIKSQCDQRKAKCVTLWIGDRSHSCECDTGYQSHPTTHECITPCEHPNAVCPGEQVCYLNTNENGHDCKCLPSFKFNGMACEPSIKGVDFLIKGLSVKNKKYLKDGKIDEVQLNKDVIETMKAAYLADELEFAVLYGYKVSGQAVICDVWLQFKTTGENIADRWKLQGKSDVLQPALELSDKEWEKIKAEKTDFCSGDIKTNICGKHTKCENNKCSCKSNGYREIKSSIRVYGDFKSVYCEDIDECEESINDCSLNTTCVNTAGDYFCKCNDGFKKIGKSSNAENKEGCTDLCTPNPCKHGACSIKEKSVDCTCAAGVGGSLCDREDENFKRASKNTVVVGAVLGTILGVVVILLAFYIHRQRKNSYSEDFTPPPRMDNAEMVERGRPMRGVNNRGYQN